MREKLTTNLDPQVKQDAKIKVLELKISLADVIEELLKRWLAGEIVLLSAETKIEPEVSLALSADSYDCLPKPAL